MISSFLRSTRNLSSVHSGSGRGCGPLRSSSDPGSGESALRSLLEPWSDCGKYPDKVSHWAAMALRYSFSRGQVVCRGNGATHSRHSKHSSGEVSRVIRQKKARLLPETRTFLPPFGSCKMVPRMCKKSVLSFFWFFLGGGGGCFFVFILLFFFCCFIGNGCGIIAKCLGSNEPKIVWKTNRYLRNFGQAV